jgi:hypothetical protein
MTLSERWDLSVFVPGHHAILLRYQSEGDERWELWFDGVLRFSGSSDEFAAEGPQRWKTG